MVTHMLVFCAPVFFFCFVLFLTLGFLDSHLSVMEANVSLAFMVTVVWYGGKISWSWGQALCVGEGARAGPLVSVLQP